MEAQSLAWAPWVWACYRTGFTSSTRTGFRSENLYITSLLPSNPTHTCNTHSTRIGQRSPPMGGGGAQGSGTLLYTLAAHFLFFYTQELKMGKVRVSTANALTHLRRETRVPSFLQPDGILASLITLWSLAPLGLPVTECLCLPFLFPGVPPRISLSGDSLSCCQQPGL